MRRAKVKISEELLADLLHFPSGTRIVSMRMEDDGTAILLVEAEGLKDVPDGGAIPYCSLTLTRRDPIRFDGWGQEASRPFSPTVATSKTYYPISSNVEWSQYDAEAKTLDVGFKGGVAYRYHGVPADVNDGLLKVAAANGSVGNYLSASVKPAYRAEKIVAP